MMTQEMHLHISPKEVKLDSYNEDPLNFPLSEVTQQCGCVQVEG